jgi:hypothetical protein
VFSVIVVIVLVTASLWGLARAAVVAAAVIVFILKIVFPREVATIDSVARVVQLLLELGKNNILAAAKLATVLRRNRNNILWVDLDDQELRVRVTISANIVKTTSMEAIRASTIAVVIHVTASNGNASADSIVELAAVDVVIVITDSLVGQEVAVFRDRKTFMLKESVKLIAGAE